MANIYDMADTWNDAGTAFTAIKMDVTDTASDAASRLLELQVGGADRFYVDKSGYAYTTRIVKVGDDSTYWSGFIVGDEPSVTATNVTVASFSRSGTNGVFSLSGPVTLSVEGAGILAQRNGTSAQTFRVYNTYTDASNYERGFMKWNSNVLEIGTEAAGTGTARDVQIKSANPSISGSTLVDLIQGNATIRFFGGGFYPAASGIMLGRSSNPWNNAYLDGTIIMSNLPTSDPVNAGQLWNDSGTLKISAG